VTLATLEPAVPRPGEAPAAPVSRRIRVIHYCPWAARLQDGAEFLSSLPDKDLRPCVSDPENESLVRMARLDCDLHGENVRALGALEGAGLEFLPVGVVGASGIPDLLAAPADGERWFVITGQHPQKLGAAAGRVFQSLERRGVRTLFYAFDEASRTMSCMKAIAPHLSVLIHDELPLAPEVRAALRPDCLTIHRSWVANLVPFAVPFCAEPEKGIVFVGSTLGLTAHRQRQIDFLKGRFKDRFTAVCDHSLPVSEKRRLARFKVGFCPEGRKFATEAMRHTHTDRPFWSGCLGLVPACEDSRQGGRLEELHRQGLIQRYFHGDLNSLAEACERALASTHAERLRIYNHYNRHETIGAVVARAIGSVPPPC
jgi:hypothetical protein